MSSPSQKLFDCLLEKNVIGSEGTSTFSLAGITTSIHDNSVVGNLIQEWLQAFMKQNRIAFTNPAHSQKFPDFLLSEQTKTDLLEVKCFTKGPNFDIANFDAYCRSITTEAYRLDADYLIFEYVVTAKGIAIKNLWLKKVWQIACGSDRSAIKIQWKQNRAVNIRPANWEARRTEHPVFGSRLEFVQALNNVQNTQPNRQANWLKTVTENYQTHTGEQL